MVKLSFLLLPLFLCPSFSSKSPTRTYYYKKSTSSSKSEYSPRKYYYKSSESVSQPDPELYESSFLQKILFKKISFLADVVDKKTFSYLKHIPHSGKYPGNENPLTGDVYPWSKEGGKSKSSSILKKSKPSYNAVPESKTFPTYTREKRKYYIKPKSDAKISKSPRTKPKSYVRKAKSFLPSKKDLSELSSEEVEYSVPTTVSTTSPLSAQTTSATSSVELASADGPFTSAASQSRSGLFFTDRKTEKFDADMEGLINDIFSDEVNV